MLLSLQSNDSPRVYPILVIQIAFAWQSQMFQFAFSPQQWLKISFDPQNPSSVLPSFDSRFLISVTSQVLQGVICLGQIIDLWPRVACHCQDKVPCWCRSWSCNRNVQLHKEKLNGFRVLGVPEILFNSISTVRHKELVEKVVPRSFWVIIDNEKSFDHYETVNSYILSSFLKNNIIKKRLIFWIFTIITIKRYVKLLKSCDHCDFFYF